MRIKLIYCILIVHLIDLKVCLCQNQTPSENLVTSPKEYILAYDLLVRDSVLLHSYCSNETTLRLSVHPAFNFLTISKFDDILDRASKEDVSAARKIDKSYYKQKDLVSYRTMDAKLYVEFSLPKTTSCAVVCFDHIKGRFLVAEITFFSKGESWDEIRNLRRSHYVLFDFYGQEIKYYLIGVTR